MKTIKNKIGEELYEMLSSKDGLCERNFKITKDVRQYLNRQFRLGRIVKARDMNPYWRTNYYFLSQDLVDAANGVKK